MALPPAGPVPPLAVVTQAVVLQAAAPKPVALQAVAPLTAALRTVVLQTGTPLAIAGTVGSLALFLSLTAHVAARNVLGSVPVRNALGVGPVPAAVAVLPGAFGVPSLLAVGVALAADGVLVAYLYGCPPRTAAYVTLIHAVVSVLFGVVLFGLLALLASAPV